MEVTIVLQPTQSPCPACTEPMIRLETLTGTVAGCLACGGIWIDHVFGSKVREGSVSEPTKAFLRHVADNASGTRPATYRTAGRREERTCPDCHAALAPTPFGRRRIILDLCDTHGTFFDLREVDVILRDAEMERALALVEAERRADELAQKRVDAILGLFDRNGDRW